MLKATAIRCFAAVAIAASCVSLSPSAASADSWNTTASRPSPWANSNSNDNNSSNNSGVAIYDVSPAAAQAALAQANYDRANSDFVGSTVQVRAQFNASNDYRQALKAVDDAQADYQTAIQPVLELVHSQSSYKALIENRARVEAVLRSNDLLPADRIALANQKMEYGAKAGRMEASALMSDPTVRQAKAKLQDARDILEDKKIQFEASVYTNPEVVAAKHALDSAKANLAAAQAYLQGALLARSDTIDAFNRQNPVQQPTNYYGYPWGQYPGGYYGAGYGYYGPSISVIRIRQQPQAQPQTQQQSQQQSEQQQH